MNIIIPFDGKKHLFSVSLACSQGHPAKDKNNLSLLQTSHKFTNLTLLHNIIPMPDSLFFVYTNYFTHSAMRL